jgi:hypothetical protein
MNKIILAILIALSLQLAVMPVLPVDADDHPLPPPNPEQSWQPPVEGGVIDPPVQVEQYSGGNPGIQAAPAPYTFPESAGTITNIYVVNSYGRVLTDLYRNETCYLIVSFNGPGYFYLWEYYPQGTSAYGHWLSYRWSRPYGGTWKIGPFAAQPGDPPGRYTWKAWYLSGSVWSVRSLSFYFNGINNPPDIQLPVSEPFHYPEINSFSSDKSSIDEGDAAVLVWNTTNASSVSISPDIGTVGASGSTSITPSTTTTYTLTANGRSGNTATSSLTIAVVPRVAPEINVSSAGIRNGETTSISWNAPGAVNVTLSNIGSVGIQGSMQVSPQETTTYTLTAAYIDGTTQSAQATVTVTQPSYLLWILIALLLVVVAAAVFLLIRRRNKAVPVAGTEAKTFGYSSSTQTGTAVSTDDLPVTRPLVEAPPARLVISGGNEILLAGNNRALGRKDFEDFMPHEDTTYISRQHINIWYENGKYYIEDEGSTNGTRVNDSEIKGAGPHELSDGDIVELAAKLRFIFKEDSD